jgi:hypothetical protein
MTRVAVLLLFLALRSGWVDGGEPLAELRKRCRGRECRPPASGEMGRAEDLFGRLLRGEWESKEVEDLCRGLELRRSVLDSGGGAILALWEEESRRHGRGFYAFRRGASPLALQAPHSFTDLYTGEIVERLFLEGRAAAAAWNTVPRRASADGDDDAAAACDLAHVRESCFQAFTRAFARVHPKGRVVQVHGFAKDLRKSDAGRLANVVLSSGTRSPPQALRDLADRLSARLGGTVHVFPADVQELGATTNAQNELLRSLEHQGFVHVELCPAMRFRLKTSRDVRRRLLACIDADAK